MKVHDTRSIDFENIEKRYGHYAKWKVKTLCEMYDVIHSMDEVRNDLTCPRIYKIGRLLHAEIKACLKRINDPKY